MIKGKKILCSTENYINNFKSFAGFITDKNWLKRLSAVVGSNIDEEYQDFLAEPLVKNDVIDWHAKYAEDIKCLNDLDGEELEKYLRIKEQALNHYQNVISSLEKKGKHSDAKYLKDSIKYSSDNQFVFCTAGKVILGVWGMQLKDEVRESTGTILKTGFTASPRKKETAPQIPESPSVPIPDESFSVRFKGGDYGEIEGVKNIEKLKGDRLTSNEIPDVKVVEGYEFAGWSEDPLSYKVSHDKIFTANYNKTLKLPWYVRFWNWLKSLLFGSGCLKWLLWILLALFLIWLLLFLFRGCDKIDTINPIPDPIENKSFVRDSNGAHRRGIYNPGDPYSPIETPREYLNVLPPQEGVLPKLDTNRLIRQPGKPIILDNRLNILMENVDKSILNLAKHFKEKYPGEEYKIVYYDDLVKRMQIEVPSSKREALKLEIPTTFAPEYELFVFDESLFTTNYIPNDPAIKDKRKSKYLEVINAPKAWDITRGDEKITIAIIDNGFNLNHPELKSKVVMPYNVWTHSSVVHPQIADHGTHVAGTALASMDNNKGLCGIAPNSSFMPVQVANEQGVMTTTSMLDGVLYALYQGADVINVSLGLDLYGEISDEAQIDLMNNHFKEEERLWRKVMNIAEKHNAVIVMAAGNNNILAAVDPTNRPQNFIIVSAVDEQNNALKKAGFSNYGNYSTISAPGVNIYNAIGNDGYSSMSGTSMAAPIVSGTVALMKSLNKNLTSKEIICILQSTGKETDASIGKMIQIDKALQKVKSGDILNCDSDYIERNIDPSSGDVQILLSWNDYNDLDLICVDPYGNTIWFDNKKVPSGGQLEIDMNANQRHSKNPIENIFWPKEGAPKGVYDVYVLLYDRHESHNGKTPYKLTAKYAGKTEVYEGEISEIGERIRICSINIEGRGPDEGSHNRNQDREQSLRKEKEGLQMRLKRIEKELEKVDDQRGK